jgi:hypothetical protein
MQELYGTARFPGVVMAVPVIVGVTGGFSGVPDSVLKSGLKALRQGLSDADLPEVIIVCDLLSIGAVLRIPGVRVIGIAAQGSDEPSLPVSAPCVAGVPDLLLRCAGAQVVIVDGEQGIVVIDPDVNAVVRYQAMLEPQTSERVFLESVHIPAYTQDGQVVRVSALVSSVAEMEKAISQGADSLIVRFTELAGDVVLKESVGFQDPCVEVFQTLLALAAGKPLAIIGGEQIEDLHLVANRFGASGQVTFQHDEAGLEALSEEDLRLSVLGGADHVVVLPSAVTRAKELIRTLRGADA